MYIALRSWLDRFRSEFGAGTVEWVVACAVVVVIAAPLATLAPRLKIDTADQTCAVAESSEDCLGGSSGDGGYEVFLPIIINDGGVGEPSDVNPPDTFPIVGECQSDSPYLPFYCLPPPEIDLTGPDVDTGPADIGSTDVIGDTNDGGTAEELGIAIDGKYIDFDGGGPEASIPPCTEWQDAPSADDYDPNQNAFVRGISKIIIDIEHNTSGCWRWVSETVRDTLPDELWFLADITLGCAEGAAATVVEVWQLLVDAFYTLESVVGMTPAEAAIAFKQYIATIISDIQEVSAAIWADPWTFIQSIYTDISEAEFWDNKTFYISSAICEFGLAAIAAVATGGGALAAKLSPKAAAAIAKANKVMDKIDDLIPDLPGRTKRLPCRYDSFLAGTLVLMASGGYMPIEDIRPGDSVVAYNTDTDTWRAQTVLDQWSAEHDGEIATASLDDGSTITATAGHDFWVASDEEWAELGSLDGDDLLLSTTGPVRLADVAVSQPTTPPTVWELEVDVDNNFVVDTGNVNVLVHNAKRKCFAKPKATPLGYTGRPWAELLPDGSVPGKNDFVDWFDSLTVEELRYLTESKVSGLKTTISSRLRGDGGLHEWCPCEHMVHAKKMGLSARDVQRLTNPTADVRGTAPIRIDAKTGEPYDWSGQSWAHPSSGVPPSSASRRFHQELGELFTNNDNLDDFRDDLIDLLDEWGVPDEVVDDWF